MGDVGMDTIEEALAWPCTLVTEFHAFGMRELLPITMDPVAMRGLGPYPIIRYGIRTFSSIASANDRMRHALAAPYGRTLYGHHLHWHMNGGVEARLTFEPPLMAMEGIREGVPVFRATPDDFCPEQTRAIQLYGFWFHRSIADDYWNRGMGPLEVVDG